MGIWQLQLRWIQQVPRDPSLKFPFAAVPKCVDEPREIRLHVMILYEPKESQVSGHAVQEEHSKIR